jgi:hypothetical protein
MNSSEKALARIIFKNKVYTSNGQAYEDLFVDIMQRGNTDFIPVKPQGQIGDRKNDGYDRKRGHYYQVFAPEEPTLKSQDAVKKLAEDFAGLYEKWNEVTPVKEFYFVFNDKYKGTFPTIEEDLANIKSANELDNCASFLAKHLEERLFLLPDDQIITVIGFIPSPENIQTIDFSVLTEIIGHILKQECTFETTRRLSAPDFDEKIKFNGLGLHTSTLLNYASYQVGEIDKFFELNGDFTKQEIRDTINDFYKAALVRDFSGSSDENKNDLVFFEVLRAIAPNKTQSVINAALVIMAYFFESCDLFEDPNRELV